MAEFHAQVTLGALKPIDEEGKAFIAKKLGKTVRVTVVEPRNVQHHRKFFKMLDIVLQNQTHYKCRDDILNVCKLRIGHAERVMTKHGMVEWPASISFVNMDQAAFEDFYSRAVNWISQEVIPGLARGDLDEEVEQELLRF